MNTTTVVLPLIIRNIYIFDVNLGTSHYFGGPPAVWRGCVRTLHPKAIIIEL